jgi:glucose/arabinose dehydrogenase
MKAPMFASIYAPMKNRFALAACLAFLAVAGAAQAQTLPPGFVAEALPWAFDYPTKMLFIPGGRLLVAEKGGIVYVVDGAVRHPLWVREEEVLNTDDRGLLSIAVDPNYAQNHYLYFLYTCDPDSDGIELDNYNDAFARLTRYQLSATDSNVVDYSTRTILLGVSWPQGFPSGSGSHTIADLEWGRDGTLLVSAGDGAQFDSLDAGGADPGLFLPGRTNPLEDIGAFRSQYLSSLDGKILRIDPATGLGLPSNPFWDGNPASIASRIWAYGLRNPFRITRRPFTGSTNPNVGSPGTLYVGDVGWMKWEELDVADHGGQNFGWPCYEGPVPRTDYQSKNPPRAGCATIGTPSNPSLPTAPIAWFHHVYPDSGNPAGQSGDVMIGGVFTDARQWPQLYRGRYVYADHVSGWIRMLQVSPANELVSSLDFAADAQGPVSFANDPLNGDLWYVSLWTGEVRRIRWTGTTSVEPGAVADGLRLEVPRPNPSRGAVAFGIQLARPGPAELTILDVTGREIWRSVPRDLPAGRSTIVWPGVAGTGRAPLPGLYFARVISGGEQRVQRIARVR